MKQANTARALVRPKECPNGVLKRGRLPAVYFANADQMIGIGEDPI